MLNGNFEHSLDEKQRVRIPAKLKKDLGSDSPVITKGANKCLYIYSNATIEAINRKMLAEPPKNQKELLALRKFASSMFTLKEDAQGRFGLPQQMIEYAEIKKEVVFIGVVDHVELWAKDRWEEYIGSIDDETYDDALLNFVGMGL